MSLDLSKIASQVIDMVTRFKADGINRQERLTSALATISDKQLDLENLKKKIAASKTTWLVAGLVDGLDSHYAPTPLPPDFTIMATDGSHIDVDRHRSTRCFLINIGRVVLRYGANPDAILDATPTLYAGDEDLVIMSPEATNRQQPIEGALLGVKRGTEECRRLAELASEQPPDSPTLALLDGSLILWGLEAYPDFVGETLLNKGLLVHLERMRKLAKDRPLALASYISYPRGTDVLNALRVSLCPHEVVNSDRDCATCKTRECDAVAGVRDRELVGELLQQGERSALFISQSSVVEKHYGEHRVYFFYLKADDEIARVEIPQWVAQNQNLLNLTHTLVLDQCHRGQGYPVALSEAHEQAVVREADRQNFWALVDSSLTDEHQSISVSGKSFSKRTRWI